MNISKIRYDVIFNFISHFLGTLMGMTNAFATLAGIFAPLAVGALTENNVSNTLITVNLL